MAAWKKCEHGFSIWGRCPVTDGDCALSLDDVAMATLEAICDEHVVAKVKEAKADGGMWIITGVLAGDRITLVRNDKAMLTVWPDEEDVEFSSEMEMTF